MPDRPVEETLFIKEYRIWNNYMETVFDRQYKSSMLHSPDHLIFLSALISYQKSIYVYLCNYFNIAYDPIAPERLKIWPTKVIVRMPKMVRKRSDLVHAMTFTTPNLLSERQYYLAGQSDVEGIIGIDGEVLIFLI